MSRAVLYVAVALGLVAVIGFFSSFYFVNQTEEALVLQFSAPYAVVTEPGLHFKTPLSQTVLFFDKRVLLLDAPTEEVIASDKKRMMVDSFARWRIIDPLKFYQILIDKETAISRLTPILSSSVRRVLGSHSFADMLSGRRAALMVDIKNAINQDVTGFGIQIIDVRIRHADLPQANSLAIYQRMQKEREREAAEYRAEGNETAQRIRARAAREVTVLTAEATRESEILRGEGDAEKTRILGSAYSQDPEFFAFFRTMQAYQDSLGGNTTVVLSPDSDFLKYFGKGPTGGK
ncbi:MAG TPA: protease modulator HflC [Rhizomicrobium sp.]|jgi:membrane protease subunit HflC|nr:protease modulator HflC [Rhizomicrobium sp.]